MEDNKDTNLSDITSDEAIYSPATAPLVDYPKVRTVLGVQIMLSMLLTVLGGIVFMLIAMMAGWGTGAAEGHFGADASPHERWQLRVLLGLNHLFMFVLAGGATVWMFYRGNIRGVPHWSQYLWLRNWPKASTVGLAFVLMMCSLPMVLFLQQVNKMLPMPDAFRLMEGNTAEMLKGLLQMDHLGELAANLLIIALIPALGEELVFRGVLQQQLMRRIANPWVALMVSAAVFSAVHLQFEGFLSRWLLGMVLGWLYWRSRNFWVPVAAHFFNNALQVLAQWAYNRELSTVDLEQDIQIQWQLALLSAFLMWVTWRLIDKNEEL